MLGHAVSVDVGVHAALDALACGGDGGGGEAAVVRLLDHTGMARMDVLPASGKEEEEEEEEAPPAPRRRQAPAWDLSFHPTVEDGDGLDAAVAAGGEVFSAWLAGGGE